jgi:hypothetical protein
VAEQAKCNLVLTLSGRFGGPPFDSAQGLELVERRKALQGVTAEKRDEKERFRSAIDTM